MIIAFALFLVIHGVIHVFGFVKAFGLAELPQLTQPVPPLLGALWLIAALLFVAAAGCLFAWPRGWWAVAAVAIAVSFTAIIPAWSDAKFGSLANGIALVGVVFGFLAQGPLSLRASYDRDVEQRLGVRPPVDLIADADLLRLPPPVQLYLRTSHVVGQPRVRNFRARMHGRFRSGPDAPWMPLTAEQYNFADEPARLFFMTASRAAIPFQGYHRYVGSSATMRVKLAGLVTVADASGNEMTRGETVTLFNDMCVMAPQALIDPAIAWRPIDAHSADATFTNGGHTIRATLEFNDAGELTNFRSEDRYQASPDGKTMRRVPWSTPLRSYRWFGDVRLSSGGQARWHEPGGEYAYIELVIDEVRYNLSSR
jgi:uncharacterized protein DUF6544